MCGEETYGVGDLKLLALANVGGLGDGGLEPVEGLVVEGLEHYVSTVSSIYGAEETHLGRGDDELDLALGGADDLAELFADALEEAEAVVLGEGGEEVADGFAGGAGLLLELGNNGRLVLGAQGGGGQDGGQLGVLGDEGVELGEGLGCGVERGRLDGGGVLRNGSVSLCGLGCCFPSISEIHSHPPTSFRHQFGR